MIATEPTTAQPTYKKEIIWDRETRDYACYLDGELAGFARTHPEAEIYLDNLVFQLMSGQYFVRTGKKPPVPESVAPAPTDDEPSTEYAALAYTGANAVLKAAEAAIGECMNCSGPHPTWRCPEIGAAMLQPYCDGQAGPCGRFGRNSVLAYMGSSDGRPLWETLRFCNAHLAQWEANATRCPSCNDPVRTPGALCPACREVEEGRPAALARMTAAALDCVSLP